MYIHSVVSIMMEAEASAALRAPETFTSVYDGQHSQKPHMAPGALHSMDLLYRAPCCRLEIWLCVLCA